MLVSRRFEPPDLAVATLSGVITSHDQADLTNWLRASKPETGPLRVLIRLETFGGWSPREPLENIAWLDDDEGVTKMAIVGDARWKPSVLTLLAAPVRALPIEYFETEAAARQWIARGPVSTSGDSL